VRQVQQFAVVRCYVRMFLGSAERRFSVPAEEVPWASRAAAVKTGHRPPAKPACSGLDGREHGTRFDLAGRATAHAAG
jgi:hypothetical protein